MIDTICSYLSIIDCVQTHLKYKERLNKLTINSRSKQKQHQQHYNTSTHSIKQAFRYAQIRSSRFWKIASAKKIANDFRQSYNQYKYLSRNIYIVSLQFILVYE